MGIALITNNLLTDSGVPITSSTSGTSGVAGSSGTSGANGAAGSSGTSGTKGTSGTSGANGVAGSSGTSGTKGTSGTTGTSGTSGANGSSGTSGTSGSSGTSVSVSGTTNTVVKFTAATTIGNSTITDTGSLITLGSNSTITGFLTSSKSITNFDNGQISIIPSTNTSAALLQTTNIGGTTYFGRNNDNGSFLPSSPNATLIYSEGSSPMMFFTNGNMIMRLNGGTPSVGGNVLINTTSDNGAKLQVSGDATFSSSVNNLGLNTASITTTTSPTFIQWRNTGGDLYIGKEGSTNGGFFTGSIAYDNVFYTDRPFNFITNGTSKMYITSGGNVLIGTTTDSGNKLDVTGIGRFVNADQAAARVIIQNTGSGGQAVNLVAGNPNVDQTGFSIAYGNTNFLRFDSSGAATFSSSVTAKSSISVSNNGAEAAILSAVSSFADGYRATLRLWNQHTGGKAWEVYSTNDSDGAYGGGKLVFVNSTDSTASRLAITSGGNVGIGTNSPSARLDVRVAAESPATGAVALIAGTSNGNNDIFRWFDGTTQLGVFKNSGNVGIGITTPNARLSLGRASYAALSTPSLLVYDGGFTANGGNGFFAGFSIDQPNNGDFNMIATHTGSIVFSRYTNASDTSSLTERMRITSGGNVLIGTTTDESYKLYVNGGSANAGLFYSTSAANQIKAAGTAPAITFTNTITSPTIGGALGAATAANQFITGTVAGDVILLNQYSGNRLYVTSFSGGVYLTSGATSWTANSDIRLKNINSYIENAVEKLSTLQTINFCYKDDKTNKQNLGLIAQEVEKIFPELIDKNGEDMLGVRYTELVPVLIKAIQELKAEIDELKTKIK
jgi:hypothetical protein